MLLKLLQLQFHLWSRAGMTSMYTQLKPIWMCCRQFLEQEGNFFGISYLKENPKNSFLFLSLETPSDTLLNWFTSALHMLDADWAAILAEDFTGVCWLAIMLIPIWLAFRCTQLQQLPAQDAPWEQIYQLILAFAKLQNRLIPTNHILITSLMLSSVFLNIVLRND